MQILKLHPMFIMPTKATYYSGAFDIYMPEPGIASGETKVFGLGFAAALPEYHVALLLPRSGTGAKHGLELNNTCGVIDSDYRGEWKAALKTKSGIPFSWNSGDRILQFLVVPVTRVTLEPVTDLNETHRGGNGFGSSGQ
jgi:dUTP pyrophosphatase